MSYHISIDGQFDLDRPLTIEHKVALEDFVAARHDGVGFPGYPYCQWRPSKDGTAIEYDADSDYSGYSVDEWLQYLIDHFLKPWGYAVNGRAEWSGEEPGDLGVIVVRDNEVRTADAVVTYPDPFAD